MTTLRKSQTSRLTTLILIGGLWGCLQQPPPNPPGEQAGRQDTATAQNTPAATPRPQSPPVASPALLNTRDALTPSANEEKLEDLLDEGDRFARLRQESRARNLYKRALLIAPDNSRALMGIAASFGREGNIAAAERYYRDVLKRESSNIQALYDLAFLLRQNERGQDALPLTTQLAEQLDKNVDVLVLHGTLLLENDQTEEAITVLTRALKLSPGNIDLINNLANAHAEIGHQRVAAALYERILRIEPDNLNARYNLGITLQEQGRLREARRTYLTILKLNPDHAEARSALKTIKR